MNLAKRIRFQIAWSRLRRLLWLPVLVVVILSLSDIANYIKLNFPAVSRALQDPVTATLIGALIGGIISFYGSMHAQRAEQRSLAATRRRDEIFKPLYSELLQLRDFLARNPCPHEFALKKSDSNWHLPRFAVWPLFKTDSRRLHVPSALASALDRFLESINSYSSARQTAQKDPETNRVIKEIIVTDVGSQHSQRRNLVYHYLPCNRSLAKIIDMLESDAAVADGEGRLSRVMNDKQIASIAEKIYEECSSIQSVSQLRASRRLIDTRLEQLIAGLGEAIRFINERFEQHERWF